MSLKNERAKSVEQTESALKEQGESFRAERQALEAEVARGRSEVQKLQVRAFHYRWLKSKKDGKTYALKRYGTPSQVANKQLLVQQQMQLQQQKQLELELRQARGGVGGVVGGGGSSADSIREVVNAAISLEFQRQRDRDYNSRQVRLG